MQVVVIVRATLTFSFSERFIKSRGRARGCLFRPFPCVRGAARTTSTIFVHAVRHDTDTTRTGGAGAERVTQYVPVR